MKYFTMSQRVKKIRVNKTKEEIAAMNWDETFDAGIRFRRLMNRGMLWRYLRYVFGDERYFEILDEAFEDFESFYEYGNNP